MNKMKATIDMNNVVDVFVILICYDIISRKLVLSF